MTFAAASKVREEVMCPTLQVQRELKEYGTFTRYTIKQQHTDSIDDLNAIRGRPYILGEGDDVACCIITGMQREKIHFGSNHVGSAQVWNLHCF